MRPSLRLVYEPLPRIQAIKLLFLVRKLLRDSVLVVPSNTLTGPLKLAVPDVTIVVKLPVPAVSVPTDKVPVIAEARFVAPVGPAAPVRPVAPVGPV